ncbi:hypothetical protein [Phaeocystidibacter marisrubri]|uniref:Uncharacterized protein n=1 Tax=Phaeocystidibacter marisrubri TaxID=1577780 RepID=A0A6L3ZCI2_9FLAO|nr:hypothetical protein [Phaeocystidibacter marisrubri]KAB2815147.1 hypothetical protein F8C82_13695 [Phaeocystidibacter marisrubri]
MSYYFKSIDSIYPLRLSMISRERIRSVEEWVLTLASDECAFLSLLVEVHDFTIPLTTAALKTTDFQTILVPLQLPSVKVVGGTQQSRL